MTFLVVVFFKVSFLTMDPHMSQVVPPLMNLSFNVLYKSVCHATPANVEHFRDCIQNYLPVTLQNALRYILLYITSVSVKSHMHSLGQISIICFLSSPGKNALSCTTKAAKVLWYTLKTIRKTAQAQTSFQIFPHFWIVS